MAPAPGESLLARKRAIYADPDRRPTAPKFRPENIPVELRGRQQWVVWRFEWKASRKKWDKPPRQAKSGRPASTTDPATWATYEEAVRAYREAVERHAAGRLLVPWDGLGFVFTKEDPYVGLDLDGCRYPQTGELLPWAEEIVAAGRTYTELSPSLFGVKLIGMGRLPDGAPHKLHPPGGGEIEPYSWGRYFCLTGHAYGGGAA